MSRAGRGAPHPRTQAGLELVWPGKYDEAGVRVPVPRCHPSLRTDFELTAAVPQTTDAQADRLIIADNLLALDALAHRHPGSADLIVADPPFATGGRFDVVTRVGEGAGAARQEIRAPAYSDRWQGGPAGLIAMLDPRLRLAYTLLAPHGSLYMHVDPTVGHAVKLLLDEIFGPGCFQREIVWRIGWVSGFKSKARNWIRNHDLIFFYVKDPKRFTFNKLYVPYPPGYTRRDGAPPTGKGVPMDDVWNGNDVEHTLRGPASMDSIQIKSFSREKTGYATQKNESLLHRIVAASSHEGDLVVDPFCGSGTTLAVARALGRRFLGIDTSRAAGQISLRRLAGTPGPALAIQSLESVERALRTPPHYDWASFCGAQPDATPGLLGRREGVGVWLASTLTAGEAALCEAARVAGGSVEVLAWSWRLPVAVGPAAEVVDVRADPDDTVRTGVPDAFGGSAVALRIERDVLAPQVQPRQGLSPLCCPRVRLGWVGEGELRVELVELVEGWPAARPKAADGVIARGIELVDGWAVDATGMGAKGGAARFGFVSFRDHHRRALTGHVDVPWPPTHRSARPSIRVRTWDALQRTADIVVTLGTGPGPVCIEAVELQVGAVEPVAGAGTGPGDDEAIA